MSSLPEPGAFGAVFEDFMRAMTAAAQRPEPEVARRVRDETALAVRSAGVSGAFIKELVRQAWLRSALDGRDAPTGADLMRVMDELLDERSALTRRLLGQQSDEGSPDSGAFPAMVHAVRAAGMPLPGPLE